MDLLNRKLAIFRTAAHLKHFSETAAALGMTQPNVTQQIARLEHDFGFPLFERSGRTLKLTPAGAALQKECDRLFAETAEIRRRVENAQTSTRFYRIGGTLTAGGYILPPLAVRYMKKHPGVNLGIRVANTAGMEEALKLRTIDLALVEGPFDKELFLSETLLEDPLIPAAAPGVLPEKFSMEAYLKSGKPFVLREKGSGTRHYFDLFLKQHNLPQPDRKNIIVANSFEVIKKMVREKMGITVISRLAVEAELLRGELAESSMKEGGIRRKIDFIYLPYENVQFAEHFIAFCRAKQTKRR